MNLFKPSRQVVFTFLCRENRGVVWSYSKEALLQVKNSVRWNNHTHTSSGKICLMYKTEVAFTPEAAEDSSPLYQFLAGTFPEVLTQKKYFKPSVHLFYTN